METEILSTRSPATIKSWMEHLERLYMIFSVPCYSKKIARALKKDKKYFFYDSSLSIEDGGKKENLVAMTLLKYCHFKQDTTGENWKLYYFRDKEKREVDFIVEKNNVVHWIVEVKSKEEAFGKGLLYLKEKFPHAQFFQLSFEEHETKKIHEIQKMNYAEFSKKNIVY